MRESAPAFGARFFDKVKQDLGHAVQVTPRLRSGSTLTVIDVAGAEPELARALTLLDRARLRIHCEDPEATCYVFRWASGYGNGADVRIQGVLEPRTGRELEGWAAKKEVSTERRAPVDTGLVQGWGAGARKRGW